MICGSPSSALPKDVAFSRECTPAVQDYRMIQPAQEN